MGLITDFFATDGFMPHGVCLSWRPDVFWLHVLSDGVIALSYCVIPAALLYLGLQRHDLLPRRSLALFGSFAALSGLTHLFAIWVLWHPDYAVAGLVKAVTAAAAVATAMSLIPVARWTAQMPGLGRWAAVNDGLHQEIAERRAAEIRLRALNDELQARNRARTEELEAANRRLRREVDERRIAEQRFRDIVDLSADWIWETDGELNYSFMSERVEAVTGRPAAAYIGHSRLALLGDPAGNAALSQHFADLGARRPFFDFVQWLDRPRGMVCTSVSGKPRFDDQGHFLGYIGIGRDVTRDQSQRRQLEEMNRALAAARDQALRANKSKSSFLAHMSHELRTPLNAVLGFAEVMKDQLLGPLEPRYESYAGHIHDSAQHLLSLINDILDLSKIEAGAYELREAPVDLAGLAAKAIRQVEGQARQSGITLAVEADDAMPPIQADQRALYQIYLNLLSNAVKFTGQGGHVVAFARTDRDGAAFGVRDTGIGMNEGEVAKALQRFGQIDNAMTRDRQGAGLGLPLVQELAYLHGGHVTIESVPGEGTTVTVWLSVERIRVTT